MTINDRIIQLIKSNKSFSQKNLSNYIGVSTSTVNNWLKLGRTIPAELIIPISEFFKVTCEYLLTGKETDQNFISIEDKEWLTLIHKLPPNAQLEFRGELKGYLKCYEEETATIELK